MKRWEDLVQAHHDWAHKDDEFSIVTRPPATTAMIAELQASFGFELPMEFHGLYQTYDGVGVTGESEEVHWLFRPIAEIPGFVDRIRDWFQETHPQLAERFFPFVDWSNGDGSGYLLSESGELMPGLFDFEHEEYEFDESQAGDDFLKTVYNSIEEFLKE